MSTSRSQTSLLNKLASYLELKDSTSAPWIPELAKELRTEGHCFGFAICDATMQLIGKQDWWYKMKGLIANWDGKEESLKEPHPLQDSDKKEPLEKLFQRMLDYIVMNYALSELHEKYPFLPRSGDQTLFLKPSSFLEKLKKSPQHSTLKEFELSIDGNAKPTKIQGYASLGGHFEKETFIALLKKNIPTIAESICLIRGNGHATALCTDADNWYFYDSNDPAGKARIFSHAETDKLVELLQILHSKDLGIECASFKDEKIQLNADILSCKNLTTPQDEKHYADAALHRLDETGLHRMALHCWPDASELIDLFNAAKNIPALRSSLAEALLAQDSDKWTGWSMLQYFAPLAIPALLELVKTDTELQKALAKAQCAQESSPTKLHELAFSDSRNTVPALIERAKTDIPLRKKLAEDILIQDRTQRSGLYMLAHCAPLAIPILIELAKTDDLLRENLAKALLIQDSNQWTGLLTLACCSPNALPALIRLAKTNTPLRESLATALLIRDNNQLTGLDKLACNTSLVVADLVELAKTDIALQNSLATALITQDHNQGTGLHTLARYTPLAIPGLIELSKKNTVLRTNLAKALLTQNNTQCTGLHMLAQYAPFVLPALIELAKIDATVQTNITNALNIKNNSNVTPIELLGNKLNISPQKNLNIQKFFLRDTKNEDVKNNLEMTVKIIEHSIRNATTAREVRNIIEINRNIPCLHYTSNNSLPKFLKSLWYSGPALGKLIEQSKQKIIDLCPCEAEGDEENIKLLGENTSYSQKDWVKLYKEKQPSCQSESGIKLVA